MAAVWVWGRNNQGQVGNGTTTSPQKSPVKIANAGMVWKIPNAMLSLPSGRYFTSLSVAVTSGDSAAVLHYTINGVDPTESDPTITSGNSVTVDQSLTLKAKAWKTGAPPSNVAAATYELKVVQPTISPASGRYETAQTVTMATTTPSATLRYTVDGTEPTATSTSYSSNFSHQGIATIKARAYRTGWTPSDTGVGSFWILETALQTPTIAPGSGSYTQPKLVTLTSSDTEAVIRYRLDGVDPDETSPVYQVPLLISRTTTVRARAYQAGFQSSAVATATLTFSSSGISTAPTIASAGGQFATRQTVTITANAGATIRYTTTGVDPTASDPQVPGNGLVTLDRAVILKARAWESGLAASPVSRADFVITGAVSAGGGTLFALAGDGTLWAWGENSQGEVGDGTTADKTTPVAVLTNVVSASTSGQRSLAAKEDGTVWVWGPTIGASPTQVAGLSNIVEVAAGLTHVLARASDGTVWAWGTNTHGQLGDGTTTHSTSPVQVLGLGGVIGIAAGSGLSLAIEGDGGKGGFVWAWGRNDYGQLGDGSTTGRLMPVAVIGIDTAVQVMATNDSGIARLADGSVRAWGRNNNGQLGNGTSVDSTVPVTVAAMTNSRAIGARSANGVVVDRNGLVWGLGLNDICMFGGALPAYDLALMERLPYLVPAFSAGVDADNGVSASVLLKWDGTVSTTGTGYLGFGSYEAHCAVRAIPSFSLAANEWLLTDSDEDGLPAWREYELGTDPLDFDTNDNGLSDGIDSPANAHQDEDGDGVSSVSELEAGTDPFRADTDGDGYADGVDAFPLDPARHDPPEAQPGDTTPPVITLTEPTTAVPRP